MHLFPPQNFGAVEEGIYRSGLPSELNYRFLESLQLRTVIVLSPESMDSLFASFLDDFRIRVIYIQNATNDGFRGLSPVTEETVIEALNVLTDRSNLPALLTCRTGKHLTGVIIGCLRKLQRWSFLSIFEEYRRFAGQQYVQQHQQHEQFVELFDTDLVLLADDSVPHFMKRRS